MIPALGAGGPGFKSRLSPSILVFDGKSCIDHTTNLILQGATWIMDSASTRDPRKRSAFAIQGGRVTTAQVDEVF